MSERQVSVTRSVLRACSAPYWLFMGADMKDGGRFHRWVWGLVDHPMEGR